MPAVASAGTARDRSLESPRRRHDRRRCSCSSLHRHDFNDLRRSRATCRASCALSPSSEQLTWVVRVPSAASRRLHDLPEHWLASLPRSNPGGDTDAAERRQVLVDTVALTVLESLSSRLNPFIGSHLAATMAQTNRGEAGPVTGSRAVPPLAVITADNPRRHPRTALSALRGRLRRSGLWLPSEEPVRAGVAGQQEQRYQP